MGTTLAHERMFLARPDHFGLLPLPNVGWIEICRWPTCSVTIPLLVCSCIARILLPHQNIEIPPTLGYPGKRILIPRRMVLGRAWLWALDNLGLELRMLNLMLIFILPMTNGNNFAQRLVRMPYSQALQWLRFFCTLPWNLQSHGITHCIH